MDHFGSFQFYILHFFLAATPQGTTLLVITLIVLLLLSFVVSGAEVALFSLTNRDINMLKTKQHPAARRIVNLLDERKEVYVSMLVANTVLNICIIILANFLISQFIHLGQYHFIIDLDLDMIVRVIIIVFVIVFTSRIFPKVWATQNNLRFAYGAAFIIETLHLLLRKISTSLVAIADAIGDKLGANRSQSVVYKELDEAKNVTTEEKNILKGIHKFGNITVKQIMKARLDVSGIEYNTGFTQVLSKCEELHYSRIPVYKQNLDEVAGILHTKDMLPHLHEQDNFRWHVLIRPPYFVPESKFIEDLLKDFQEKRIHFAVVVDEFGGTSGIVTLEDILEEIIGEIKDEFDDEESGNKVIDENNFVFEGKTMIHDACLVLELAGEFPTKNSVINSGDFDFTITETDKNRILQLKVTINR